MCRPMQAMIISKLRSHMAWALATSNKATWNCNGCEFGIPYVVPARHMQAQQQVGRVKLTADAGLPMVFVHLCISCVTNTDYVAFLRMQAQ